MYTANVFLLIILTCVSWIVPRRQREAQIQLAACIKFAEEPARKMEKPETIDNANECYSVDNVREMCFI